MTWPPPPPKTERVAPRPWDPRPRGDPQLVDDSDVLVYVVIDELIGEWAGLSMSRWPDADDRGRLRFDLDTGTLEVGTTLDRLRSFLASGGRGRKRPGRLHVGSVFAARVKRGSAEEFLSEWLERPPEDLVELADLGEWLRKPRDITEQARTVAKLAYYGAMTSVLPSHVEDEWNLRDGRT